MFERAVLTSGHDDLLGDAIHVVSRDVVDVHGRRLAVTEATAAHQVDDQHERVITCGAYSTKLFGRRNNGALGVVLWRLDAGHRVVVEDTESMCIEKDRARMTTLSSKKFIRRLASAG
ncbi:hypothetical protein [Streptomyces griseofuscus]|uniref:hypothetical protein n=1 Tax=Streptomyces griseofuscus TaxID=146922 RepID=UPI0033DC518C